MTFALPSCRMLLIASAALLVPAAGTAQDAGSASSKTGASQVTPRGTATTADRPDRRVFLDEARPAPTRPSVVQAEASQIPRRDRGITDSSQISTTGDVSRQVPQLSRAELDATLAQLTPAERSVLLQAVEGTDICDRPPAVAAIIALCKTRIETRPGEVEKPLTAEERLLRGGLESNGMPAVEAVIARLSRASGSSSSDDMSNQAIASVALTPQSTGAPSGNNDDTSGLSAGTDAVINAIVQQLGGPSGAVSPPGGRP